MIALPLASVPDLSALGEQLEPIDDLPGHLTPWACMDYKRYSDEFGWGEMVDLTT